jgi:hypothetical protein
MTVVDVEEDIAVSADDVDDVTCSVVEVRLIV